MQGSSQHNRNASGVAFLGFYSIVSGGRNSLSSAKAEWWFRLTQYFNRTTIQTTNFPQRRAKDVKIYSVQTIVYTLGLRIYEFVLGTSCFSSHIQTPWILAAAKLTSMNSGIIL